MWIISRTQTKCWINVKDFTTIIMILLHQRKIKTYEQFESFVNNELCDWYNKRFRKFISSLNQFDHIEPEIFKNNFVVSETRKIRKGNYLKVDDRYLAPFNRENKRVAMEKKVQSMFIEI